MKYLLIVGLLVASTQAHSSDQTWEKCNEQSMKQARVHSYYKKVPQMNVDCRAFIEYAKKIESDPKNVYLLKGGEAACSKREDYVNFYNKVRQQGTRFIPSDWIEFKRGVGTCRINNITTLAQPLQKVGDLVEIRYWNQNEVNNTIYRTKISWVISGSLTTVEQYQSGNIN